ncbi:MAG: hypothetical protein U9Q03_01450 [Patescibacteria group bacterium]|nr:hypothetical protein [Patescibacteria group bacterium]
MDEITRIDSDMMRKMDEVAKKEAGPDESERIYEELSKEIRDLVKSDPEDIIERAKAIFVGDKIDRLDENVRKSLLDHLDTYFQNIKNRKMMEIFEQARERWPDSEDPERRDFLEKGSIAIMTTYEQSIGEIADMMRLSLGNEPTRLLTPAGTDSVDETEVVDTGRISGDDFTELTPADVVPLDEEGEPRDTEITSPDDDEEEWEVKEKAVQADKDERLEQVKEIVGRLDALKDIASPISADDVRSLLSPDVVAGLEEWQISKILFRIRRIVREKFDDQIQAENEKRGFIVNSPPSAEEEERIENYGEAVNTINQVYAPDAIMDRIRAYLSNPD